MLSKTREVRTTFLNVCRTTEHQKFVPGNSLVARRSFPIIKAFSRFSISQLQEAGKERQHHSLKIPFHLPYLQPRTNSSTIGWRLLSYLCTLLLTHYNTPTIISLLVLLHKQKILFRIESLEQIIDSLQCLQQHLSNSYSYCSTTHFCEH